MVVSLNIKKMRVLFKDLLFHESYALSKEVYQQRLEIYNEAYKIFRFIICFRFLLKLCFS